MKTVEQCLTERTSVRRYTYDKIPPETMDKIYRAIENTPTSYNGQQFSVIDVSDQAVKEELWQITGQKQIKTCSNFLVFCADYNKISLIAGKKNIEFPAITDTMDGVMIGVIDASLAMMSAVVAAESMGLGSNCIGYLRTADPARVAEILRLPAGVFVVCGLAVGFPNEHPDLKPKQAQPLVIHRNHYRDDSEKMTEELVNYDAEVAHYNRTRSGHTTENDWAAHIIGYYDEAMKYQILEYLRRQGFNINH